MSEPEPTWRRLEKLMCSRETGWWEQLVDAIPELRSLAGTAQPAVYHAEGDVAEHTRLAVAACPTEAGSELLWVALLHDIGKPATTVCHEDGRITSHDHAKVGAGIADDILLRLNFPDASRQRIVWAVRHHTFHHAWNIRDRAQLSRRHWAFISDERFPLLLEFLRIDSLASRGNPSQMTVADFFRDLRQEIATTPEGQSRKVHK